MTKTDQPRWQFIRQVTDESMAPPAPADEALWRGHGCIARYVDEEHALWSANATVVMLAWAEAGSVAKLLFREFKSL